MKQRVFFLNILVLIILMSVLITACGQQAPAIPAETPTETKVPTATLTPEPTATNTPVPTPTATPDQFALKTIYQPLINGGFVVQTVCAMTIETANKRQSGEIDGLGAFGEILLEATLLKAIEDGYLEWEADASVEDWKTDVQAAIDEIQGVLGRWLEDEITSVDVPGLLQSTCEDVKETLKQITVEAYVNGLTEASMDEIFAELQEGFSEIGESFDDLESDGDD